MAEICFDNFPPFCAFLKESGNCKHAAVREFAKECKISCDGELSEKSKCKPSMVRGKNCARFTTLVFNWVGCILFDPQMTKCTHQSVKMHLIQSWWGTTFGMSLALTCSPAKSSSKGGIANHLPALWPSCVTTPVLTATPIWPCRSNLILVCIDVAVHACEFDALMCSVCVMLLCVFV